ncbi:hypothetical protein, partial [Nocardia sp.]|uniref:hypothetical protein n=1 Tax=Nocardia sp. TaxID=1821 RepID=UPI0025870F3A
MNPYTIFAEIVAGVLALLGARGFLLLLMAVLISGVVSYVLLAASCWSWRSVAWCSSTTPDLVASNVTFVSIHTCGAPADRCPAHVCLSPRRAFGRRFSGCDVLKAVSSHPKWPKRLSERIVGGFMRAWQPCGAMGRAT